ncbi:MAG: replication-relaxation family protein [Oscillospiraceae bacterium]|jgi:DNA-binding HxlR family transcriptional regulator|nr:replication-relaxation family protein [Oscillospiraceae bacterium]
MRLVERDYTILRELERWRFALSRQIRLLCGFPSQRTCDRRLKLLIENGYIDRKHILYGVPSLYTTTHKGRQLIGISGKSDKIKVEQITHDIAVVDTVIYFHFDYGVKLDKIITEKELHKQDGFGTRKHQPDFVRIFDVGDTKHCIEVELTAKSKERMLKIMQDNFENYYIQFWVVPRSQSKIRTILEENANTYPNIEVIALETIADFVKKAGANNGE